jgi:F-type H+-transporting ATPase subunit b
MDATLHQLGGILLQAVPTIVILLVLHFYLKAMFFRPIEKVLHERYNATEGARKVAEESLARAAAAAAKYEAALRSARGEVYSEQEKFHKQLQEQSTAQLKAARERADAMVRSARAELDGEISAAKTSLAAESDRLAEEIATVVLRRSAA